MSGICAMTTDCHRLPKTGPGGIHTPNRRRPAVRRLLVGLACPAVLESKPPIYLVDADRQGTRPRWLVTTFGFPHPHVARADGGGGRQPTTPACHDDASADESFLRSLALSRNQRAMNIIAADVIVTIPNRNFVTLKITTVDGLTGLGDATLNGHELTVVSYLHDHVAPY